MALFEIDNFQKIFENIITDKTHPENDQAAPYESQSNIELLKDQGRDLSPQELERFVQLFSLMMSYFDGGIFLQQQDLNSAKALAYFYQGKLKIIPWQAPTIRLPEQNLESVYRLRPNSDLLINSGFKELSENKNLSHFSFRLTEKWTWILSSTRAEPWLQDFIQKAHTTLLALITP